MSVALLSRGVYAPSRSAARALLTPSAARAVLRAPQPRMVRTAALRTAASGADALMRRVLVGGIVASGLAAHGGVRAMAAGGGAIPAPSDVAAPPADAKKTASGLAYKTLKAGSGACGAQAARSLGSPRCECERHAALP